MGEGMISADVGRRAWAWMVEHENDFFVPAADASAERKRTKFIAELALIAAALVDDMPEARPLLTRAWAELSEGEQVARSIKKTPTFVTAYWPFRLAGFRSAALEASLAETAWLGDPARLGPFARFAIGVVLGSIGLTPPWNERDVVLANRFFDPPTSRTHPLRAEFLAHAIMWRSEMGRNGAGVASAAAAYREVSPIWHRLLAASGWLDPLGEMIIADLLMGAEPPSSSIEMLAAAQREDGSIPLRVGGSTQRFEDVYHTTCVAALAGNLARRRLPKQQS
jgi:hypothetical protein